MKSIHHVVECLHSPIKSAVLRSAAVTAALAIALCGHAQVNHFKELTLKTNLVGAAAAIANVAAEYQFAPRFSIEVPAYYSCWNYFVDGYKFRGFAMQPAVKYYFDPRQHWSVGLHAGFAYYNLSFDGDYRYQSHHKNCPAGGGGVELGYRVRFGADSHWGMEIVVGAGGYLNERDKFKNTPCDCDPNDLTHYVDGRCPCRDAEYERQHFYGIDKFNISISYTIDFKKK